MIFTSIRTNGLFSAIKELNRSGFAVDYVTIIDQLTKDETLEKIGASYLTETGGNRSLNVKH
jgi:replicative DNA helicase